MIFDLTDFDAALEEPWEWNVKRLAVSIVAAGRSSGLSDKACHHATEASLRAYRKRMRQLAEERFLAAWYSRLDPADAVERFQDHQLIERDPQGLPEDECRQLAKAGRAGR